MSNLLSRLEDAIALAQTGEREQARAAFTALWPEIQDDDHAMLRCLLAHHMADVQDDVHEELRWDLRALEAAAPLTDADAQRHHAALTMAQLYPSLHLNVADACRRAGDTAGARHHLARGLTAVEALPDEDYGRMIRGGLERLAARLDAEVERP